MATVKHIKIENVTHDIQDSRNVVVGSGVNNVVKLTLAEYNALATKDVNTVYCITDAPSSPSSSGGSGLPEVTSSDSGKFLTVTYNNGTYEWAKTDALKYTGYSIQTFPELPIHVIGTSDSLQISSHYLTKTDKQDWSWIQNLYWDTQNGTTVTTLQDTLDSILPSVSSGDYGRLLWVDYASPQGYHWSKNSPFRIASNLLIGDSYYGILLNLNSIDHQMRMDENGIEFHRDTTYPAASASWNWLKYSYYDQTLGTRMWIGLQDTLDAKANTSDSVTLTTAQSIYGNKTFFNTQTFDDAVVYFTSGTVLSNPTSTDFNWIKVSNGNNGYTTLQSILDTKQKTITVSSSEPTSNQGSNGDIWIVI